MSSGSGSQLSDLIVRQYLISRNYSNTIKAFDQETKQDKTRGRFQAHKLVDILLTAILQTDLAALRETWQNLEFCLFRHLDHDKKVAANALRHSLYKCYLVEAVRNKHPEKVEEFFALLTTELQHEAAEWKDWLLFPYTKAPQDHKSFAMYFSRSWMDIFLLSLHNFLALVMASVSKPILQQIDALQIKCIDLARDNAQYRKKLQSDHDMWTAGTTRRTNEEAIFQDTFVEERRDPQPLRVLDPSELIEDFTTIESLDTDYSSMAASSSIGGVQPPRGFVSNVFRRISSPSSPLFRKRVGGPVSPQPLQSRRIPGFTGTSGLVGTETISTSSSSLRQAGHPRSMSFTSGSGSIHTSPLVSRPSGGGEGRALIESCTTAVDETLEDQLQIEISEIEIDQPSDDAEETFGDTNKTDSVGTNDAKLTDVNSDFEDIVDVSTDHDLGEASPSLTGLMELGQERLMEHRSAVNNVRFSRFSSVVSSLDSSGGLLFWQPTPIPQTIHSASSKGGTIFSFDWSGNSDTNVIIGNKNAGIRLYNLKDSKSVQEVTYDTHFPKIHLVESYPSGTRFICGSLSLGSSAVVKGDSTPGRLSVWNTTTMKMEFELSTESSGSSQNQNVSTNTCITKDPAACTLITGCSDGRVRTYDLRTASAAPNHFWVAHGSGGGKTISSSTPLFGREQCVDLVSPTDRPRTVYSLGTDGFLVQWDLSMPGRPVTRSKLHPGVAGPFHWMRPETGFNQEFLIPRGHVMRINSVGDALLTCCDQGAKIYQLSKTGEPSLWLTLQGHSSPVMSLDWYWGEETVTCLTASMDGTIMVTTLMTTAR